MAEPLRVAWWWLAASQAPAVFTHWLYIPAAPEPPPRFMTRGNHTNDEYYLFIIIYLPSPFLRPMHPHDPFECVGELLISKANSGYKLKKGTLRGRLDAWPSGPAPPPLTGPLNKFPFNIATK